MSYIYGDDGVKTSYSYDPHGNIEWVAQDFLGFPRINYTKYLYEVIGGKVSEVRYNEGRGDQFYHRYEYDKDNRLVAVRSSRDGQIWDRDAGYSYYAHGDLRRREVGEDKLQGLDFTYTLQGSLKAVNHPSLTTSADPGGDGAGNGFASMRGNAVARSSQATAGARGAPAYARGHAQAGNASMQARNYAPRSYARGDVAQRGMASMSARSYAAPRSYASPRSYDMARFNAGGSRGMGSAPSYSRGSGGGSFHASAPRGGGGSSHGDGGRDSGAHRR